MLKIFTTYLFFNFCSFFFFELFSNYFLSVSTMCPWYHVPVCKHLERVEYCSFFTSIPSSHGHWIGDGTTTHIGHRRRPNLLPVCRFGFHMVCYMPSWWQYFLISYSTIFLIFEVQYHLSEDMLWPFFIPQNYCNGYLVHSTSTANGEA